MIITDNLVYLHIPKTGGTFVEHVMRRVHANGAAEPYIDTSVREGKVALGVTHQHQTIADVPDDHQDKEVLVTVRNPYDHYVSSFEFGWWRGHPNTVFNDAKMSHAYPSYPDLTFPEFLVAMNTWDLRTVSPKNAQILDEKKVGFITWQFVRFIAPRPIEAVRAIDGPDEQRFFSNALSRTTCIPTHQLNEGLYEFLVSRGSRPDDVDFILDLGKIYPREGGRSEERSWQSYYTPELKALVKERDRLLFRLFPEFDV